ncbi:MAG: hypothetical protein ABI165_13610 [Bryobacteraceae bacterium]
MKRKPTPEPEPIVADEILRRAKEILGPGKAKRPLKCVVCSAECAPTSMEGLCWVCRRLKISAWRESDPQMTAQE